jgi:hypothetical protein
MCRSELPNGYRHIQHRRGSHSRSYEPVVDCGTRAVRESGERFMAIHDRPELSGRAPVLLHGSLFQGGVVAMLQYQAPLQLRRDLPVFTEQYVDCPASSSDGGILAAVAAFEHRESPNV